MTIYLIRHGETPGNAARIVQKPDIPLSERGLAQAARVGERLRDSGIVSILASDLNRAAMTADAVAATTGVPITHEPLLHERNFGDLRGTPYADLDFELMGPDVEPPAGESWAVFHDRADRAFQRVLAFAGAAGGDIAVVTHGLVCHRIHSQHLTTRDGDEVTLHIGNTSVTEFDLAPPHRVSLLACTAHLEGIEADLEGLEADGGIA